MDKYQKTFATWNKVARLYADRFMKFDLYNATYDVFCDFVLKENSRILELGCGPGNITNYLLSVRPDFIIHGVDAAPNMVQLATENNPNARFSVMDIRDAGKIEDNFDGIVCGFCIPYLSRAEVRNLFDHAHRLLNKQGIMYLSFEEGDYKKSGYRKASTGDAAYFYYYELATIRAILQKTGFKELKVFHIAYERSPQLKEMHLVVIAEKC